MGCFRECECRQLDDDFRVTDWRVSPASGTALNWRRRLTRLLASTVVVMVTAAVVCWLWSIRSAIVLRIVLTATVSYSADETSRGAAGAPYRATTAELRGCAGGGTDVALDDRPVFPLPVDGGRSMPARSRAGRAGGCQTWARWWRARSGCFGLSMTRLSVAMEDVRESGGVRGRHGSRTAAASPGLSR